MARIRTIKPELPQSESMGRVSRESRLCFILLWTLSDDAGRLRGNSRMLSSLLYPYDDDASQHMEGWLSELHAEGCITRYEIDGDRFIQINKWLQHQKIDKPSPSKIPAFVEDSRILAKDLSTATTVREDYAADQGEEGSRKEGSGAEKIRASRLTQSFEFPETWMQWVKAERPDLDPARVFKKFRDFHADKESKDPVGWFAAFKMWVHNERAPSGSSPAPVTVSGPKGRDPVLLKMEDDAKRAVPMPMSSKEQFARIRATSVAVK